MAEIPESQDRAYTVKQVAEIMSVSIYTVHEWLRTGELRGAKLKSKWRIMRSDLSDFVQARKAAV